MTLTNKTIAALSQFAIKARKDIGVVKAANMVNDPKYACNLLIQATLSENDELVTLTKKISTELNIGMVLINAIETYINDLKVQGASADIVHESKYFLIKLAQHVYGIRVDGATYRQAVNALLLNVEHDEKVFCVNLARNFYRCWRAEDSAAIKADNEQTSKFGSQKEELIKLWHGIDEEFLYAWEDWPLNLYMNSMRQIGVAENDIDTRQKLAKVIIVELRKDHNSDEQDYRTTINRIQPLFSSQEMRDFFLIVSREFYSFLVEPQAILNDDADLFNRKIV